MVWILTSKCVESEPCPVPGTKIRQLVYFLQDMHKQTRLFISVFLNQISQFVRGVWRPCILWRWGEGHSTILVKCLKKSFFKNKNCQKRDFWNKNTRKSVENLWEKYEAFGPPFWSYQEGTVMISQVWTSLGDFQALVDGLPMGWVDGWGLTASHPPQWETEKQN